MDLKLTALTGAVNLIGIAIVLRQIYKSRSPTPEPIRIVTDEIERRRRSTAARSMEDRGQSRMTFL